MPTTEFQSALGHEEQTQSMRFSSEGGLPRIPSSTSGSCEFYSTCGIAAFAGPVQQWKSVSYLCDQDTERREHSHPSVLDLGLSPLLDVLGVGALGHVERVKDLHGGG